MLNLVSETVRLGGISSSTSNRKTKAFLKELGFEDPRLALQRLIDSASSAEERELFIESLPILLASLRATATPDASLVNFERFVQNSPDRVELFRYMAEHPRAVEILVRLFVSSQFLTEILLRNPTYLQQLTQHKRLAEYKSRDDFLDEAMAAVDAVHADVLSQPGAARLEECLNAVRRYQRWELLRIGACDTFGLMDFKSLTVQLSLLADAIVQCCLKLTAGELDVSLDDLVVLAFGKLGGEELNYSSDIDLVFLTDGDPTPFWSVGQKVIKSLTETTADGFLYRVDMRLRPWGKSGALVNSVDSHLDYIRKHGQLWERQALIKARPIAGNLSVGHRFLSEVQPLLYTAHPDEVRDNVQSMKQKIERELQKRGRNWGDVKSGSGSIRDIEFVVQFLQITNGGLMPEVRSTNTLNALTRLADRGIVHADEYQHMSMGYVFLRTIEHALQLIHGKQTHSLPTSQRELEYFASRMDFPDAGAFVSQYERHSQAVRAIYDKYIVRSRTNSNEASSPADPVDQHVSRLQPDYVETFTAEQIAKHAALRERLDAGELVSLEAEPIEDAFWRLTVTGVDQTGDLSMICGLLFVYGFDIVSGHAFTDSMNLKTEGSLSALPARGSTNHKRHFVDVFELRAAEVDVLPETWRRYETDLKRLLTAIHDGRSEEAHGKLAKKLARVIQNSESTRPTIYPVEVEFDNQANNDATVLHITSEDTPGFLFELSNGLSLSGINIENVLIKSSGNRVFDTLLVTEHGRKITSPQRQQELRATVVLIKHFTHLLPESPNPEVALLQFREFLHGLIDRPDWTIDLAKLERSDVLSALTKLLGVSTFLWEDFLRIHHESLFPVVADVDALAHPHSKSELQEQLKSELDAAPDFKQKSIALNDFKNRQMFRTDMRHILGQVSEFGMFSAELTDVAEVIVGGAFDLCHEEVVRQHGAARLKDGRVCRMAVLALGKCGGRELGFASDIELMFVYEGDGKTQTENAAGTTVVDNQDFYGKLIETLIDVLQSRADGIFHIDLRLRPYGNAGSLAVSRSAFESYFAPGGAAWPYERQALVKLRAIAGDSEFGHDMEGLRDECVYRATTFDVSSMRSMREKQVSQHVRAGTINAKLSPGGLVDCEYIVQGLQLTHGRARPELRATNTLAAIDALHAADLMQSPDREALKNAYMFLRKLIDALRMVRGNAKDLTVPDSSTEEFEFLARRLGYFQRTAELRQDLDAAIANVCELSKLLGAPRKNA